MKSNLASPHYPMQRGMVLFEVIIALTVFTLVAFSLVMALDATMKTGMARNEIDAATRGLENQRALLHASRLVPMDKDLPDDGSGIIYHLAVQVEQIQDQKNIPLGGMYRATITANWKSDDKPENLSVSELIYQP